MKTALGINAGLLVLIGVGLVGTFDGFGQDQRPFESNSPWPVDSGVLALNLATNADQAWKLVSGMRPLSDTPKVPEIKSSALAADMCREFVRRYPEDASVRRAHRMRQEFLMRTIELGNVERIAEFEGLFPKKDTELARMRAFRAFPLGPAAVRQEWEKNLRALVPWTSEIEYEVLLLAEQSDPENARRLAEELIALPAALKPLKARAMKLLENNGPVGKTVQLKTTTLDGQELDLEQWKGKVVLLHFWTPKPAHTSSVDPDASGLAIAKRLYEKFHDRGLEVLSINLSRNEKLVRAPVRPENKIPWPHYWANTNLSTELRAVAGLPPGHTLGQTTFALLDRTATVRDRDVPRAELGERIEKLLK